MPAEFFKVRWKRKSNTIPYRDEENGSIIHSSCPIKGFSGPRIKWHCLVALTWECYPLIVTRKYYMGILARRPPVAAGAGVWGPKREENPISTRLSTSLSSAGEFLLGLCKRIYGSSAGTRPHPWEAAYPRWA